MPTTAPTTTSPTAAGPTAPASPSPALPQRPRLRRQVPLLWRAPGALQIGLDSACAVVVHGADEGHLRWLTGLDGTLRAEDHVARLVGQGRAAVEAWTLLDALARARALDDGPDPDAAGPSVTRERLADVRDTLALTHDDPAGGRRELDRRAAALVEVRGAHRLGAAVATMLAAAGVGRLRVVRRPGDPAEVGWVDVGPLGPGPAALDLPAAPAVRASALAAAPGVDLGPQGPADVVVLAVCSPVHPDIADDLVASGTPHLIAAVDGPTAQLGPWVVPGVTACLRCEAEHRTDRDPAWPLLLAQLASRVRRPDADPLAAALVGSSAAAHVLAALARGPGQPGPPSVGAVLHARAPAWWWSRRPLAPHPRCWCPSVRG